MLVLSRKVSEKIVIGENIVIEVASVSGKRVRLAITAPDGVRVRRSELVVDLPQDSEVDLPQGVEAEAGVHS